MKHGLMWEKIESLLDANGFDEVSKLQSIQIAGGNLTIEWFTNPSIQYKEPNRIRIVGFLDDVLVKPFKEIDDEYKGEAYCIRCKEKRSFVGKIKVSDSGRRMAKGVCPVCGTNINRILGKEI